MRLAQKSVSGWLFLLGWLSISSAVVAQTTQGMNAIATSGNPVASVAFVDAPQYANGSQDICAVIASILTPGTIVNNKCQYGGFNSCNSNGVVVDARGFTGTLTCSVNPFENLDTTSFSNTVLLPANTIPIQTTWVLSHDTRIIGEGPGITVLQAASGFSSTDMIDMGISRPNSFFDDTGVVIEHLGLNGGGLNINGIVNQLSEELSYVNDVAMTNFGTGTGLTLGTDPPDCPGANACSNFMGAASNSGPYSNIYFSGSGTCLSVIAVGARLVQGLTCAMTGSSTSPAIILDAPNNRLKDVTITNQNSTASRDGVLVGTLSTTNNYTASHGNVLMNIAGTNLKNVVHISSHTSSNSSCPPGSGSVNDVCDVTILGVSGSRIGSATIQDDLSGTTLTDPTVAMYIVGEQMFGGTTPGNSRFTTSPSVPSWLVGGGNPTPSTCTAKQQGSLYSCTGVGGACTDTIYGCAGGTWTKILQ